MINGIIKLVVRYEGKKFLHLKEINNKFFEIYDKKSASINKKSSLYVHIPFCKRLCPYCSFNRVSFNIDKIKTYYKILKKEIELYNARGFRFKQVYFGGGTPTVDMNELMSFIDFLHETFDISQISLETNPSDINRQDLKEMLKKSVKRLSIGIQSFDNQILKDTGRAYLRNEELRERIISAKGIFKTLNIDLIFNFPTQTVEQFRRDVEAIKDLEVDQVTFYPLMPSPRRKTAIEKRFNKINTARERKFYQVIIDDILRDKNFIASTPWCFTRISSNKRMIDEYIVDYNDYIGTGSGAVSHVNGLFCVNSFSLDRYQRLINNGKLPIIGWRPLSTREKYQYYLLTKLFGLKLDKKSFHQRFNKNSKSALMVEFLILKTLGVIRERNGVMRVTDNGLYYVSTLMKEFFSGLNGLREYCITNKI